MTPEASSTFNPWIAVFLVLAIIVVIGYLAHASKKLAEKLGPLGDFLDNFKMDKSNLATATLAPAAPAAATPAAAIVTATADAIATGIAATKAPPPPAAPTAPAPQPAASFDSMLPKPDINGKMPWDPSFAPTVYDASKDGAWGTFRAVHGMFSNYIDPQGNKIDSRNGTSILAQPATSDSNPWHPFWSPGGVDEGGKAKPFTGRVTSPPFKVGPLGQAEIRFAFADMGNQVQYTMDTTTAPVYGGANNTVTGLAPGDHTITVWPASGASACVEGYVNAGS